MASAKGGFADLHVHTWYSDSSLSPAQAVEEALRHGVGVFAVADHEGFEGSREAEASARRAGLCFISAAEMECTHEGRQLHILCYGANRDDPALRALARKNRATLDGMSDTLIERMRADYPALSLSDYANFRPDRALGGWKGLQYLKARGATDSLKAGMAFYDAYGVGYEQAGFPSLPQLLDAIHGAGGKAVLAHPGHTLRALAFHEMVGRVRAIVSLGLDGIECHYPLHSAEATRAFRDLCDRDDLLITAGSDCHGAFGHTRVGEMDVPGDCLRLGDLLREGARA